MSSTDIIVKRRPSRPQAQFEAATAQGEVRHHSEEQHHHAEYDHEEAAEEYHHHHHHASDASDGAPQHRPTCNPSAAAPHAPVEPESDEDDYNDPAAAEEEGAEAAAYAAEDDEECPAAAAAPPPPQVKTARPKASKAKKAHRAKKATKAAPAAKSATAAAAAAPKKKKPTQRVSIANVETQPPVPEGVNTPRSVAVCDEHGVNPAELAHYPKSHFQGPGVADEVAELRYHSYEKRREARMAELLPAYRAYVKANPAPARPKAARPETQASAEAEEEQQEASQRPTQQPTDEEEAMRQQFEAQHQRLLEQERRKASGGSAYDSDGRRQSSVRASYPRGTSPRAGNSPTSPGRHSVSSAAPGRPTVDQPYSAVKIYSTSIAEERPLTQSEAVMIDDINEREARRLDTQERAAIIQENKQLMHVQRGLEKERRASAAVQYKAQQRERSQQEKFKHSNDRLKEAAARRERIEDERAARLQESIAEKEGQVHANDPYASLLSRRRQSAASTRRASSNLHSSAELPAAQKEAPAEEL